MKPGKALLIVVIIIVVLVLIAWGISATNKKKTTSAVANQPTPNPEVTGRYLAVASMLGTDYTQIFNGKPAWVWVGKGPAATGYIKITEGKDSGWSVLNDYLISGKSNYTCLERSNSPGHPCIKWKEGTTIFEKA